MSFHSRPDRLRIPAPSSESAGKVPTAPTEISSAEVLPDETPVAEFSPSPPIAAPSETAATGSALKAWGSPEASFATAPHVREIGAEAAKIPAQKIAAPKKVTPKSVPATASPDTDQAHQRQIEAHRETRILVIENDVEAADHVINILESDGYAVEIATDPTYGAMLAQSYLPHLIIMGALSEQLSGADFMRSLRNTTGFAERAQVTPVLYLIDNSQLLQQRFQGLRDTPLTSTIFKPANEHELLQKIERALSPNDDFPVDEL